METNEQRRRSTRLFPTGSLERFEDFPSPDDDEGMVYSGSATNTSAQPKKRGRKPKLRLVTFDDEHHWSMHHVGSISASDIQPKKRGRPPKPRPQGITCSNAEPKRRGRPPKVKPVEANETPSDVVIPVECVRLAEETVEVVEEEQEAESSKERDFSVKEHSVSNAKPHVIEDATFEATKASELPQVHHLSSSERTLGNFGSSSTGTQDLRSHEAFHDSTENIFENLDFEEFGNFGERQSFTYRSRDYFPGNNFLLPEDTDILATFGEDNVISGHHGAPNLRNDDPVVPEQSGTISGGRINENKGEAGPPSFREPTFWGLPDMFVGSGSNQPRSSSSSSDSLIIKPPLNFGQPDLGSRTVDPSSSHSLMAKPVPILGFGQSSPGPMTAQPPFNQSSSNSLMAQPIPILDYGQPSQSSQTVAMSQPQSYFQSRLAGMYRGPSPISTTKVNNSETAGPISGYPGALNLGGNQPSHPTMMQQTQILLPNNENQRNLLNSRLVGRENQTPFLIGESSSHIDSSSQDKPALGQGMGWNHPSLGALPSLYSGGGTIQMSVMPESSRLLASPSQSGGPEMRMEQLREFHSCTQLPSLLPLQPPRWFQSQPVLPLQLPMHPELQAQSHPHYSLQPPTQPQFPLQPMQPLGPLIQPLRLLQPPMNLQTESLQPLLPLQPQMQPQVHSQPYLELQPHFNEGQNQMSSLQFHFSQPQQRWVGETSAGTGLDTDANLGAIWETVAVLDNQHQKNQPDPPLQE